GFTCPSRATSRRTSARRGDTCGPRTKTMKAGVVTLGKLASSSSATRIDGLPGTSQPPPERWSLWWSENHPPAARSASQTATTGVNAIEDSDMVAIPDPSTFRVLPDGLTGRMICDIVTPDGEPYAGDPRHVLRLALERMQAMGFDTFNVGPEAEYFLFRDEK